MNMNMYDLNNHKRNRPFATTQIACRICDQVFLSTQALINHIETHMVDDDQTAASRRQTELSLTPLQRAHHHRQFANPNPNFPHSNIPSQTPLQLQLQLQPQQPIQSGYMNSQPLPAERKTVVVPPNPNSTPGSIIWDTFPVTPSQRSSLSRKSLVFGPQLSRNNSGQQFVPMRRLMMEERSSSYFTKPLINQLQKAIPDVVKPVERGDESNNGIYDAEMMDLTLKL